jgi:hypothetical protein
MAEQPPAAPPSEPPRKSAGPKIALIVVSGILGLIGLGLALAGGAILAVFGSDGTVTSGYHQLDTRTTALVSTVADLEGVDEIADVLGEPEVKLTLRTSQPTRGAFAGVGRARDVERYLATAPVEEVGDFDVDPFELRDRTLLPGARRPAPPTSRTFWVAEGSGRETAELRWNVSDGDYRMVVMNADGSRGVNLEGSIGVGIPHLPSLGWILLGVGLALLLGGAAGVILTGVWMTRRP